MIGLEDWTGEGTIANVIVTMSGLATIVFEEGHSVLIESGSFGVGTLARAFGSVQEAIGKRILYRTDAFGVMEEFGVPDCTCPECQEG